jgi:hypothetical protein
MTALEKRVNSLSYFMEGCFKYGLNLTVKRNDSADLRELLRLHKQAKRENAALKRKACYDSCCGFRKPKKEKR